MDWGLILVWGLILDSIFELEIYNFKFALFLKGEYEDNNIILQELSTDVSGALIVTTQRGVMCYKMKFRGSICTSNELYGV